MRRRSQILEPALAAEPPGPLARLAMTVGLAAAAWTAVIGLGALGWQALGLLGLV